VPPLEIINLRQPSEVREFPYGKLELFHIAGHVIGRATYQPGRRWTQHVGRPQAPGSARSGTSAWSSAAVLMADGTEQVIEPGDPVRGPAWP